MTRPYRRFDTDTAWTRSLLRQEKTPHLVEPTIKTLGSKDLAARIKELIKLGLGDGSIAVRLNNQGIECRRADVLFVRTGSRGPDTSGSFEETSLYIPE